MRRLGTVVEGVLAAARTVDELVAYDERTAVELPGERSGRAGAGLSRFAEADLHRTAALTGTALVGVHVTSLMFDPYAQLRLVDLVFPFLASYRPLYLGLGTLALELLLAVVVTSLLRHRIGPRAFRLVHWATYVLWPFVFLHGLGAGTDAAALWFKLIAVACASSYPAPASTTSAP